MVLVEAIRQAFRTLRTEKLRSFLTMFGVLWGTASVVFLVSWGLGVEAMMEAGYSRAGKNLMQAWPGVIGEQFTPASDRRELWFTTADVTAVRKQVRIIDAVAGESRMWSTVVFREKTFSTDVRGVEPAQTELRGVRMAAGRGISRADLDLRRRVAVLGTEARRRLLGARGGIGSWIRIKGQPFQVIGIHAQVGTQLWRDQGEELDAQVWIPLATFFAFGPRYGNDEDIVNTILLRLRDRRDYDDAKREARTIIGRRLRVSATDEEAVRIASSLDQLRKLPLEQTGTVLLLLGATTLLIGGIGILTMMLDSVQERRQEIGVRLAVGGRRRDILGQFFLETFVMTALGGLAGLALGVAGCRVLASFETADLIPLPILRAEIVFIALGVMTGVGIASGIIPAWRAAKVDPSVTLRAE